MKVVEKLEAKAIVYLTGISREDVIQYIRMQEWIQITYKNGGGIITNKCVGFTDINECIKNHKNALLKNIK